MFGLMVVKVCFEGEVSDRTYIAGVNHISPEKVKKVTFQSEKNCSGISFFAVFLMYCVILTKFIWF